MQAKILAEHSESHFLINKAALSIKVWDPEKDIISLDIAHSTLSRTFAVLPQLLGFSIREKDQPKL